MKKSIKATPVTNTQCLIDNDKALHKYNDTAQLRFKELPDLIEEIQEYGKNGVFASGKVSRLVENQSTSVDIVPLLVKIQTIRERVGGISRKAFEFDSNLSIIEKRARSYITSKYQEIARLRPEAVRKDRIANILNLVDQRRVEVDLLKRLCDSLSRDCYMSYETILEIQKSLSNPVDLPRIARSDRLRTRRSKAGRIKRKSGS